MSGKDTKFMVVPKGSFSYQRLGEFLNTFYATDDQECSFRFRGIQKNGFFIPHEVITKIKGMFQDWNERFEFFSQEGGGEIREYAIPVRKKSAKEKQALKDLEGITGKKK